MQLPLSGSGNGKAAFQDMNNFRGTCLIQSVARESFGIHPLIFREARSTRRALAVVRRLDFPECRPCVTRSDGPIYVEPWDF